MGFGRDKKQQVVVLDTYLLFMVGEFTRLVFLLDFVVIIHPESLSLRLLALRCSSFRTPHGLRRIRSPGWCPLHCPSSSSSTPLV